MNTTMNSRAVTTTYGLHAYYTLYYSLLTPVIFGIYLYGYIIIFLLGFIGNISSLLTFSRKILRKVSTSIFFLSLSVTDTIYLLTCVYDFTQMGLKIPDPSSTNKYQRLCQFRNFIAYSAINCSAWTLFSISADRWIRTRYPTKVGRICTPRNAAVTLLSILVFSMVMNSHYLTPMFGAFVPGLTILCAPNNVHRVYPYYDFYTKYWQIIRALISIIIPAILMVLALGDMFVNIYKRRRSLLGQRTNEGLTVHSIRNTLTMNNIMDTTKIKQSSFIQKQMFILMLSSIIVFLVTTLPMATYYIIVYQPAVSLDRSITNVVLMLCLFTFTLNINYAINFYIHCLTSKLFRKEFISIMFRKHATRINTISVKM
ncbi:unnamed protein product [Didymodactylos carnosus]|uniref:G-protein coupled receptors family 1 profile domain-containing protein n=1 Tax=Didymodactylos carnosus TaxID=1234261 RepID=A0A815F8N5_9BILA|nr:unnamed protein product [Didymodactylos carnosus]CAF1321712.1 unnamed protein product [Didymodactylos carnosus]CAF3860316.1 unnamed protein product [Didymodactylos carnosus]CAF4168067.1 unnamed protein product [Didymodactylos carnosus]